MRIIRILPVSLLVTAGVGFVGCGDDNSGASATSAELTMPKASPFESIVQRTDLSADQKGVAKHTDPTLVNAWGSVLDPVTGWAWISANGSGSVEVLNEDGVQVGPKHVPIPAPDPTGEVLNLTNSFKGDDFIFASESGIVVGLKRNDTKHPEARFTAKDGAVYKGIALAFVKGQPRLFLTDFHNGKIDVLDGNYACISCDDGKGGKGSFMDKDIPAGFAPFNILAAFGDDLIISYAMQNAEQHDDVPGNGNGFVDLFDTSGSFDQRLLSGTSHPELSSPWGLALSAEKNEKNSIDLMIGNFGDQSVDNVDVSGHINVYELTMVGKQLRATFEGPLGVMKGKATQALQIPGLWGFVFGNGKGGFGVDDIYFNAGPGGEIHGLFGELDFVSPRN